MNFDKLFKEKIETVREITEGFSVDKKYIINDKYIVRMISEDRIERFKFVYETQKKFQEVSLCQKVIDYVIDLPYSYYITEYLPGKNGLEVIEGFSEQEQYDFGVQAAKELVKFHLAYPDLNFDTKKAVNQYFKSKTEIAINGGVRELLPSIDSLIETVQKNLHYLYDLKGVITHSDYHLFNMIFDGKEYKGVIDFERCRPSHFLTDFRNNTPHNSTISPWFASGYIDGYIEEFKIEDFFKKYNTHDLMMSIAALVWVREFNPENLDKDIEFIKDLFNDIGDVSKKPTWYKGKH